MRTTFKVTPSDYLQAHLNSDDTVSITLEVEPMPELDRAMKEVEHVLVTYNHDGRAINNALFAARVAIEVELAMNVLREHMKPDR